MWILLLRYTSFKFIKQKFYFFFKVNMLFFRVIFWFVLIHMAILSYYAVVTAIGRTLKVNQFIKYYRFKSNTLERMHIVLDVLVWIGICFILRAPTFIVLWFKFLILILWNSNIDNNHNNILGSSMKKKEIQYNLNSNFVLNML